MGSLGISASKMTWDRYVKVQHMKVLLIEGTATQIIATEYDESSPEAGKSFFAMPAELSMMIYRHMTSATLFRVAQSSQRLRQEARPLFWSQPGVWFAYRYWPYAHQVPKLANGFQESTTTSVLPAACMLVTTSLTQLLVDMYIVEEHFWWVVCRYFTSVTRVMYHHLGREALQEREYNILRKYAGGRNITVFFIDHSSTEGEKYLWVDYDNKQIVELSKSMHMDTDIRRELIIRIPNLGGPVGAFIAYQMVQNSDHYQRTEKVKWGATVLRSPEAQRFKHRWEQSVCQGDSDAKRHYKDAFVRQLLEDASWSHEANAKNSRIYHQLKAVLQGLTQTNDHCTKFKGRENYGTYLW